MQRAQVMESHAKGGKRLTKGWNEAGVGTQPKRFKPSYHEGWSQLRS